MITGMDIKEKRCAMLVWEKDGVYGEMELVNATVEKIKEMNELFGFPPKGKVMNHRYFAPKGE